jgi:hypothetical protein
VRVSFLFGRDEPGDPREAGLDPQKMDTQKKALGASASEMKRRGEVLGEAA